MTEELIGAMWGEKRRVGSNNGYYPKQKFFLSRKSLLHNEAQNELIQHAIPVPQF